ncbi:ROK family protein [Allorhizobium undicola]|uniref:ROK family protein n=1 Tax=Allorhizobium undicola TaxID=78527 RepID=UPI003D356A06
MIVCFDIGGTAIKGGHAYASQDIRALPRLPTPANDFEAFTACLRQVIGAAEAKPRQIALSICGIIDAQTGKAVIANIPCLHGRALQEDLEAALGLPVLITNDADCFVLAEAELGAGRGHSVVFGIILGTGVGGGLVVNGALINEHGGFAGEWGHAPVAATSAGTPPASLPRFQCGCGQHGCIDATCSARGMERLHQHLHGEMLSSENIVQGWIAGDEACKRSIDVYVDVLSAPLALCVNLTGATIIPVGGGLSNAVPLLEEIDKAVQARILRPFGRPLIVQAQCRMEPGLIGAALAGLRASRA